MEFTLLEQLILMGIFAFGFCGIIITWMTCFCKKTKQNQETILGLEIMYMIFGLVSALCLMIEFLFYVLRDIIMSGV